MGGATSLQDRVKLRGGMEERDGVLAILLYRDCWFWKWH